MEGKGFLAALFDLSFTEFITTRWVRGIFILCILLYIPVPLAGLVYLVTEKGFLGLCALLVSVVVFLIGIILSRMFLEAIVVVFRIEEHARAIAQKPPRI